MEKMKILFEKELVQTQLEIQEEILKNISMEIHDNIGQIMLLTRINISILQTMEFPPEGIVLIDETKQLMTKAIEDVTELSRSIHSDRIVEMGIINAITEQLESLSRKGLFKCSFEIQPTDSKILLGKGSQLVIFRMFQEISKNIIKHSEATEVIFKVIEKDNGYELIFTDNGRGFQMDTSAAFLKSNDGIGMRSLQTRAALIGAQILVNSALQKGTSISIFIPAEIM